MESDQAEGEQLLRRQRKSDRRRKSFFPSPRFLNCSQFLRSLLLLLITSNIVAPIRANDLKKFSDSASQKRVFSVLRLHIENESQLRFLMDEFLRNSTRLDFWKEPSSVGEDAHVMIARGPMLDDFAGRLHEQNISLSVMIENVSDLIRKRESEREKATERKKASNGEFQRDDPSIWPLFDDGSAIRSVRRRKASSLGRFSMAKYHSFSDVIHHLNALALNFPSRVQVQPIGTTHEGRQIPLIKIGTGPAGSKPAIWIDGGIHAREWISPAAVLYMIDQLVTGYDTQPMIRQLIDQLDWFIVPLLNPDGYEYSRSSSDPEVRLWRKNRSPVQCTQISTGLFSPPQSQCCQGVDLNRNFDWFFGQVGSSSDPCSEIYAGNFAFSEPETRSVRDFISQQRGRVKTFMTFHSYSQILMYPFGHSLRTYPQDVEELSDVALRAAQALQSTYGTKYTVGTGADTLYPASGGSEDWAKGRMGVKFSFLFELRPEDSVYDGFLLPESQILPTARETWEAVKVIAASTLKMFPLLSLSRPISPVNEFGNAAAAAAATVSAASRHRTCRDIDSMCTFWSQQSPSACQIWATSMRERCPLSCGFCSCRVTLSQNLKSSFCPSSIDPPAAFNSNK
uniref:ShKT domain-containing protein n=1 Tax=Globodera rostochiensis TaxID=31243 RepID=A0A914HQK7_GLORO